MYYGHCFVLLQEQWLSASKTRRLSHFTFSTKLSMLESTSSILQRCTYPLLEFRFPPKTYSFGVFIGNFATIGIQCHSVLWLKEGVRSILAVGLERGRYLVNKLSLLQRLTLKFFFLSFGCFILHTSVYSGNATFSIVELTNSFA